MNTCKLAKDNGLSRVINSVNRDSKRDQIIITVDVSQCIEKDCHRKETYFFFTRDTEIPELVNVAIESALSTATLWFLGLCDEGEKKSLPAKQEEVKEEVKEEKKPAKSKSTAKKKVVKKVEEVSSVEDLEEFSELNEDDDYAVVEPFEPQDILFDKSKHEHTAPLSENISALLPSDWKKSDEHKKKVRALIAKLHGKVDVMNAKGEVLDSFNAFCEAELA